MTKKIVALIIGLIFLFFAGAVNAAPVQLINNGGFESGFSGWNQINSGSGGITINNGSVNPAGPLGPTAPFNGVSALTFQSGPGSHTLWQAIDLTGFTTASLSWFDRLDNWAGAGFSDPNQEWRVELWDTNNSVLTELFSTDPGDNPHQPWTARNADLTSFVGGSYRLAFTQQDNLGFFNAQLDNVNVFAEPVPEPGTIVLFGAGLIGLVCYRRKIKK